MTARQAQPNAATALATRRENGGQAVSTLADDIRNMEKQYQLAMPRGAEATRLVRDALTALRTTRNLERCERTTVLGGLMTCAQLGLRPAVLGHAWLLPFWDGRDKCYKAQLVIGYQGYVDLAYRSGRVLSLAVRTVYSNDDWELEYRADGDYMRHRPNFDADNRGEPRLYYARAQLADGGYAFTDPMGHKTMLAYRDRYAKARNKNGEIVGPWKDEFEGMAHKTMVRRLAKLLPKSTELAIAIEADDGVRVDLSPEANAAEVTDHDVLDGSVVPDGDGQPGQAADGSDWPDAAQPGGAS